MRNRSRGMFAKPLSLFAFSVFFVVHFGIRAKLIHCRKSSRHLPRPCGLKGRRLVLGKPRLAGRGAAESSATFRLLAFRNRPFTLGICFSDFGCDPVRPWNSVVRPEVLAFRHGVLPVRPRELGVRHQVLVVQPQVAAFRPQVLGFRPVVVGGRNCLPLDRLGSQLFKGHVRRASATGR